MNRRAAVLSIVSIAWCLVAEAGPAPGRYRVIGSISLGGSGGWDYLAADPAAHRLYVVRSDRVQVVDTESREMVGEVPGLSGAHGVALAPALGRGYVTSGRAGTVTVFDLKTLATLTTVKVTGDGPDAILFEPVSRRVFTFNGRGRNATAIDTATNQVVGTIALDAKPEFAVADGTGKVFVNLEDASAIAAFDARTLEVTARWPIAPGEEPTGLAIDLEHRRLFSVCANRLMVVLDADSGKVITTVPIGHGVDGAAFDPTTRCAFASCGDGSLTVVREASAESFIALGSVPTKPGARTVALDPVSHLLYLPTARFGPPPSPTTERPNPWPSVVAGSFEVLIVAG